MVETLEARKTSLIDKIEELKRKIEILKWPEYKEPVVSYCTDSIKCSSLDVLQRTGKLCK